MLPWTPPTKLIYITNMENQKTLIALATGWGPRHGGINSFNYDFLKGFAAAFVYIKVICIVKEASQAEVVEARQLGIDLRSLPYDNSEEKLDSTVAETLIKTTLQDISSTEILFLGHDVFSGELANSLAGKLNGKSAVIHHMSYDSYKGYETGISTKAQQKSKIQKAIFEAADFKLAIGPTLRDELRDWFGPEKCGMLIPGLPEIEPTYPPSKWTVILFGRLSPETSKIKQTKLGIAAVARCERDAREDAGLAKKLKDGTRIKLFGVDTSVEAELRDYVEQQAGGAVDMHALPYTEERAELFDNLRRSSVALMPSWHEGFGLVGWEAIAAGVPLIVGRDSGLYRFLNEEFPGLATGCVTTLDIRGSMNEPYFQSEDLSEVVGALKELAADEDAARKRALSLKKILGEYTPKRCAEDFASIVGWGHAIEPVSTAIVSTVQPLTTPQASQILRIPIATWDASKGYSYSQLLRAEEACVPFDDNSTKEVVELIQWVDTCKYPLALRLYTGAGGSGKTRLLIETFQQLSSSSTWRVGFLSPELSPSELRRRLPVEISAKSKWLIGIDYAETRREQLATIVEVASRLPVGAIRIVLLARDAGEWWERLPTDYPECEHIFAGDATDVPKALLPLHSDADQRLTAYQTAVTAYARRLGIVDPAKHLKVLPDLRADHFGRPLFLQMAALLALHGERADSANGLTDAILRHELRYWKALASAAGVQDGERIISVLMILATLAGGLVTEREAWASLGRSEFLLPEKADFTKLFRALCPLYPGRQGLQPLRPDLLGEALIASALSSSNSDRMLDAALASGVNNDKREHALMVLTRSVRLRPSVEGIFEDALCRNYTAIWHEIIKVGHETGQPLISIACAAYKSITPAARIQIAAPVLRELMGSSLAWDSLAFLAADAEVEKHRLKLDRAIGSNRDVARANYAIALRNRAMANHFSGNDTAALLDSHEATEIFRRLRHGSLENLSNYCWSLNSTSNRSTNLGKYREAILIAEEAVEGSKVLSEKDNKQYLELYATSLANLATCHANLGEYTSALEYGRLSAEILEPLQDKLQETGSDAYARVIGNLSLRYGDIGDSENSLKFARNSSELYEELAASRPDRYTAEHAQTLINLGATYSLSSKHDEGYASTKKAVDILRPLADRRPERFSTPLAIALLNLSICQSMQGRFHDALMSAKQSRSINEHLLSQGKLIEKWRYADSLVTAANRYADVGMYSPAVEQCKLAEMQMLEEDRERPGVHAARNVERIFFTCLFSWLNGESCDVTELRSLELTHRSDIVPSSQLESRAFVLFMSGCVLASSTRTLAEEQFLELIDRAQAASLPDFMRLTPFYAISAAFIADVDYGNMEKRGRADEAKSQLLKQYSRGLPCWVNSVLDSLNVARFSISD
jgi:glycosyltransferase involved in cell wall biosynthesis